MWGLSDRWFLGAGILLLALLFAACSIALRRGGRVPHQVTLGVIVLAFVLQSIGLYLRGYSVGACPLGNPFEILQFIAWSLVLLYLLLGTLFQVTLLGFFTAGLAALLGGIPFLFPGWDTPRFGPLFSGNPLIELHASLAIFSYGAFALLSIVAAMFLLQDRGLRQKSRHALFQYLPSINKLDQICLRLLGLGLAFLTLALVVGGLTWMRDPASVPLLKLLSASAVWLCYLAVMILRLRRILLARPYAWACLVLFLIALVVLWPVEGARFGGDTAVSSLQLPLSR
jgi:HemX protein